MRGPSGAAGARGAGVVELKQMRIFLAVAEELHFGRAAARLHMAQPALSAQVKSLEERLGAPLFARTTRHVALTRAGEAFLPEARGTVQQAEAAMRAARAAAQAGGDLIKIGGIDSATAGLLPAVIRAFRRAHPAVDVRVTEMLSDPALHALEHRQLDVTFGRVRRRADLFEGRHVLREELVAIVPADHPLAARERLTLADVAAEPLVMPSRANRPILTHVIEGWFEAGGAEPRVVQTANERHMIVAMVAAGLGLAITPAWVRGFGGRDVAYRPLDGAPTVDTHAHWRRDERLDAVRRFVEALPDVSEGERRDAAA